MKFIRTLLILLAGATAALADVNLFTSSDWIVDGATDPSTNASSINIFIDQEPAGTFSELKFYFNMGTNNYAQVFSITGNGTWQPALPPPGVAGGAFQLASYWDCAQGFIGPVAVTELGWKSKPEKKGYLDLTGKLSNNNSLQADKLQVRLSPAKTNDVRADLKFQLKATRAFCLDQTRHGTQDEFRVVTMVGNYVDQTEYTQDLARYIKLISKTCAGIYGCYSKKESFCISLTNAPAGFLVNTPRHSGDTWFRLMHTTMLPQNTPTLAVGYFSPSHGAIKPQGFYTPTDDPTAENVEYWGNWTSVKKSYKAKQTVAKVRVALEAEPPKIPGCDTLQAPAGPPP